MPGPIRRQRRRPARDNNGVGEGGNNKSAKFVFTHNNWDEVAKARWIEFSERESIEWFIMQAEVGEDGTEHLQGAFKCKNRKRFATIHREVGDNHYHLEVMRGTEWEAWHYCEKAKEGCDCEKCETARTGPQVAPDRYFIHKVGEEPARTNTSSKTRQILNDIERYDCGCPIDDPIEYAYDHFTWNSEGGNIQRDLCTPVRKLLMCSPHTLPTALYCLEELDSSDDTA